ncbi:nitroreductase [Actinocorallia herbida]|uniref:Nitroreductase n=1 Tax=Actinocorallia herbida TaxID=58109 RepID=A0A3N1CTW9_9ACTN|nr:nitroreductase [Actinocorallia herbida]
MTTAIATRRSVHRLIEPAPDDREVTELVRLAAAAPDHGLLRPWRWVLLRGTGREELGACLAADAPPERRAQVSAKTSRAPLLATLVFAPAPDHRVPEWEQLIAAGLMAYSLMLLLHARGYASVWRTGPHTESGPARRMLGLQDTERLLGWLYIGTEERPGAARPPGPPDVSGRILSFGPARCPVCRRPAPPDHGWTLRSRHRTSEGLIGYSTRPCGCVSIAVDDRVIASFSPAKQGPPRAHHRTR